MEKSFTKTVCYERNARREGEDRKRLGRTERWGREWDREIEEMRVGERREKEVWKRERERKRQIPVRKPTCFVCFVLFFCFVLFLLLLLWGFFSFNLQILLFHGIITSGC